MMRRAFAGLLFAVVAVGATAIAAPRQERPFPHEDHQGLFPVCAGCHVGVAEGDEASFYPPPAQCASCHNGVDEESVAYDGPPTRVTNVVFDHVDHAQELEASGDPVQSCESCHSDPGGGRMSVDETEELDGCWSCHAHERDDHFAVTESADCVTCHVPLAQSGFDRARLDALPAPSMHEGRDFLLDGHGVELEADPARCATCHTVERCVSCHVDGSRGEFGEVPAAGPGLELPDWSAEYPEPASHDARGFAAQHEPQSSALAECATCHTSNDCVSCHVGSVPTVVAELPSRGDAVAPGVHVEVTEPGSHDSFFFMEAHANLAAAEPGSCATCHTETYCVDCHDGPADGGYHPADFVTRHPADAFGQAEECASCHSTAAFCRACHEETGLGSVGRLGLGYHDAEPLFLIRHGQAARQSLESCASCHQQTDCVQCHGVLGAFSVSPHTERFNAEEAWARSPRTCLACHISNPVGGAP